MCDSAQLKKPFYQVAQFDSRNLLQLGKALGIKPLEQESQYNIKNPGHAISTAGEYALGGYLGSLLGAGEGGAQAAGEAGASAGISGGGEVTAEQLAQQQALAQLAQQAPQGLANTMEAGMTDTGYTPSSLWNALKNANSANGTPLSANLANYGKAAGENAMNGGLLNQITSGGGSGAANKAAVGLQGLKMLFPEQQAQRPPQAPPMQGQQGPLPDMYPNRNVGPYGTSAGNSLGFTEEQKKKLRAMGYQI